MAGPGLAQLALAQLALAQLRVAVTHADQFPGADVARAAARAGADVICVGRRPGPVGRHFRWEGSDEPDLAGADLVVHFATGTTTVDSAAALLAAARARPVVWVSGAHGRDEIDPAGERLALEHGAVVLRPAPVYGTTDPDLPPRIRHGVRGGIAVLAGRDVRLNMTSVHNLVDACLNAWRWPPGSYEIADAQPYRRDRVLRQILAAYGIPVRMLLRLPVPLARAAARMGWSRCPFVLAGRVQPLDLSRARAQGWHPGHDLDGFLDEVGEANRRA